ncbi:MAG TPA: hypothetical protein VFV43_03850 [Limnobacter sp.]|nr:hypothetical protein [Limnobacter sp.]
MPSEFRQMPDWRKPDGTPAGEIVFSRLRHFVTLDGWRHSDLSDKFAMVVVNPGDYFLSGNFNRYTTVSLQENPPNLLPKPAPAPLGHVRFVSEMHRESYKYTKTVDYYAPVITGVIGAGFGAVPVTEDVYTGSKSFNAKGYRNATPTVTEHVELNQLNGGLIQTLKITAKAGEILVLPEIFIDVSTKPRYDTASCSNEGRREWICPILSVPFLYKPADVQGFLDTLKTNSVLNPWSTLVKEAPITHNDQLKPTGFVRDGYGVYVLGEIPSELKPKTKKSSR